jgi:histidyl-tRNA synthetase
VLAALLGAAGLQSEHHGGALVALDKLDKIGAEGVAREFAERGLPEQPRAALLAFDWLAAERERALDVASYNQGAFKRMKTFIGDHNEGGAALANLEQIVTLAKGTSAGPHLRVDPSLARGLSYYTGAIMEINVADLAGSLGGGGRYDNLVGMFLGQNIPACGFSLGLERILVVMGERNMFPSSLAMTPADVMIATFDASSAGDAMRVAALLREKGLRVLVYPDADKIGKQIKYADGRGIPYVALLGEDEIKGGTITVKDLRAQAQTTYDQSAAGAAILEALRHRG